MNGYRVESEWVHAGLRCVATRLTGGYQMDYRCGYVGVPPGHPLHGADYEQVDADVHGGVTYSDGIAGYPVAHEGLWWFGFDCAHAWHGDDDDGGQPLGYVESECASLAEQLAALAAARD